MVGSPAAIGSLNPVAIAAAWLLVHPDVEAAFAKYPARGVASDAGVVRIEGIVKPPYPMLRIVTTPGGSLNDARWRISPEVLLEAWGDTDGYPGPAALQEIVTTAVVALRGLEDKDYQPWEPVVTHVDVAAPQPLDDPSGQTRWMSPATLTCHPALDPSSGPPPVDQTQGG